MRIAQIIRIFRIQDPLEYPRNWTLNTEYEWMKWSLFNFFVHSSFTCKCHLIVWVSSWARLECRNGYWITIIDIEFLCSTPRSNSTGFHNWKSSTFARNLVDFSMSSKLNENSWNCWTLSHFRHPLKSSTSRPVVFERQIKYEKLFRRGRRETRKSKLKDNKILRRKRRQFSTFESHFCFQQLYSKLNYVFFHLKRFT